jgi:GT2 family glycosyltransferase
MITIIYSTHKDQEYNDKFKKHLLDTIGVKDPQILQYENHNQYSLSNVYNRGIKESKHDIVVCCHNDIKLEKNWGKKLLDDFSNNPEFGIIGKAGSCYFPESGVYWEKMRQTMVGQVYHYPKNQKKWLSKYSPKLPFLIPVVTVDGLFISFDKTKIKHRFDESYGKFHFYDHGFAVPNYLDGIKLGITSSFEITHESVGQPNQEFWDSKVKFLEKWGSKLPLDLKPEKPYVPEIKRKKFKGFGKVAIIIPTKGNLEMLFDCIDSFQENCDTNIFNIFIADTGSEESDKIKLREKIKDYSNVTLIEYDYYNFGKINNDVVKNHVSNQYSFILFSNNDIKILNDVITGMLSVFNEKKNTGTVGARLHFRDNTIQHDGIFMGINKNNNSIGVSHLNLYNYYNFHNNLTPVFGNTGGLLMVRKNTFESCGMFNENYISCFEDVELNIRTLSMRLENYVCSNCVAYHYESTTRNEDPDKLNKLQYDYTNNLIPAVRENWEYINNKLLVLG